MRLSLALAALLAACSSDAQPALPSGAACDESLSYAGEMQGFFESYCLLCHSSEVSGDDRFGAPVGADFDRLEGIQSFLVAIDAEAGAGPDGVFETMPLPGLPDQPSLAEREALSAWLACGAPE